MSEIDTCCLSSEESPSQTNIHPIGNIQRDASVQTLLTASDTANISSEWFLKSVDKNEFCGSDTEQVKPKTQKVRRKRIPDKPYHPLGLWSIMKDLIGQNLTNVALPVNFNEPLSILQRMAEPFEYSYLLDRAADCENVYDQIAYLSVFCISGYAASSDRSGKPFNPLLGETYEFDRTEDLGWKCIAEKVTHRPSNSALHCESAKWIWWENLAGDMQFRGRYIRIVPTDYRYVRFKTNQKTYRLERAETVVHNIVFGKVWIDHSGDVEIICLNDTVKCTLNFVPYSSFSRGPQRKVSGNVTDVMKVKRLIRGFWNDKIEVAFDSDVDSGEINASTCSYKTIWKLEKPNPESSKYYHFSEFACELNEFETGVAPTDSRLRPDLRLMEEAKWDESNEMKLRLEEKQRQKINQEVESASLLVGGNDEFPRIQHQPTWFVQTKITPSAGVGKSLYVFNGGYWEAKKRGDWSSCPDIFL